MSAQHSPFPWSINREGRIDDADGEFVTFVSLQRGYVSSRKSDPIAEANAAFIVRAVNAHDELVAALRDCQRLFKEALPRFDWGRSALDANAIALLNEVPMAVRAALAKATGEGA
jgi:hypothetical protein